MYLELFHGRPINPINGESPDLDSWGTEGPIFRADKIQITYACDIRLANKDFSRENWLHYFSDMVYYDGMGYGDIIFLDSLTVEEQERLVDYDEAKASTEHLRESWIVEQEDEEDGYTYYLDTEGEEWVADIDCAKAFTKALAENLARQFNGNIRKI